MLGLLIREYDLWCKELEAIVEKAGVLNRSELSRYIAHTLEDKDILLRILNMNLYEIEQNSRVERLAEFKIRFKRLIAVLNEILRSYKPDISAAECEEFCETFSAFLFGVFPFTKHSEKQLEAMRIADVHIREPSIFQMVYQCLVKLLPEKH